jgi:5'-nucleotidase
VYVCAPASEQSGKSHSISLTQYLAAHPRDDVEGAAAAWAIEGTPSDSVMLALHGPLFPGLSDGNSSNAESNNGEPPASTPFDLCVSGINRGDNAGLHVIYSGTVGAAREAACKGVPAVALSIDDYGARKVEHYAPAAALSAALVGALLDVLAESPGALSDTREGLVLNVNVPKGGFGQLQGRESHAQHQWRGVALTHQGTGSFYPRFEPVADAPGPHEERVESTAGATQLFRNYAGTYRQDDTPGSDMEAVAAGWASVTPLGLRSDLSFKAPSFSGSKASGGNGGNGNGSNSGVSAAQARHAEGSVAVAAQVVARAAATLGLEASGIEGIPWPVAD